MPIPRVVVWKSDEDIFRLKALFYDENPRQAICEVLAHQTRGPLPHSVESTALLMSARLMDEDLLFSGKPGQGASYAVRQSYCMAIVRFVNGLIDPFQRSTHAISMHLLAKQLQLPPFFVEARHSATHEALPSLELLRSINTRALFWLRDHYWSANQVDDTVGNYSEADRNEIKSLFREWRSLRRDDPLKELKRGDQSPENIACWKIIRNLSTKIQSNEQLVMDVMLQMNVLVPKSKNSKDDPKKMQNLAYKLFGPLLKHINTDGFLTRLACYGIDAMTFLSLENDICSDPAASQKDSTKVWPTNFCEVWTEWVQTLIISKTKKNDRPLIDDPMKIINLCIDYPGTYTYQIVRTWASDSGHREATDVRISQLLSEMKLQLQRGPSKSNEDNKRSISDISEEVDHFRKRLRTLQGGVESAEESPEPAVNQTSQDTTWKIVENWNPRPLGVL